MRLDQVLTERFNYESRARARDAIRRGCVRVGGRRAEKPGQMVAPSDTIAIDDPAASLVSRAALKLLHALTVSGLDPKGRIALDLGASTGGFTQVLLQRGAARVHAIDVGHGQLHASLHDDPRVRLHEGLNARDLSAGDIDGDKPGFVVSDLSFISLTLALPPALALALPGACGIFLVKPQFEAGRDAIGKGGIVRDRAVAEASARGVAEWLSAQPDWTVLGFEPSPIEGGDGNREFLLWAVKADE